MNKHKFKTEIADRLGGPIGNVINSVVDEKIAEQMNEIRIRANKPVCIMCRKKMYFVNKSGRISEKPDNAYSASFEEVAAVFARICRNSIYAFSDDIKNGFVTIPGGHRVGIC